MDFAAGWLKAWAKMYLNRIKVAPQLHENASRFGLFIVSILRKTKVHHNKDKNNIFFIIIIKSPRRPLLILIWVKIILFHEIRRKLINF